MVGGMRGLLAAAALCSFAAPALAAEPAGVPVTGRVERITFADPKLPAVKVVRGMAPSAAPSLPAGPPGPDNVEIVTFGSGRSERVKVIRGSVIEAAAAPAPAPAVARPQRIETVHFTDTRLAAVTVVRGSAAAALDPGISLFGPASAGELDRVAFAVDGAESSHGADLRMWRPQPNGPQGPMQVSDAAARDVGGGDRFDLRQNRMLGRAYLARMFERYGNWPDALAAYNWGPGNVDAWIVAGRPAEKLPFGVTRYVAKVLRDALISVRL